MLSLTREIKGGIFWGGVGGTSPFHTKLGGSPLGNKNLINKLYMYMDISATKNGIYYFHICTFSLTVS